MMQRRRKSPAKQVSIESFIGSDDARVKEDVQFKVPFLPLTAPQTPTPAAFNADVPLYAHQQRSLYRMLQIESHDEEVSKFNFGVLDYFSRGGCLADAIGTGKTATMLALIVSEPINATLGGNLLVAPSHLLVQWKMEVDKFVQPGEIDVVVGLRRYLAMESAEISNRTLVLVGVDEAIASLAHYYHFRQIYPRGVGKAGRPMSVDLDALQEYILAAKHVSKAYSGPVWVTKLHIPDKPWRRVVFEEVQDLVLPGKESQDCFIQLTRRCDNVWLITATPFPAKAESIYANNQLLGFKRLRLLPHDPVFDDIKKKLYLRNCAQVKHEAITSKIRVRETYLSVRLHPRELLLCKIEHVLSASKRNANFHLTDDGSSELTHPPAQTAATGATKGRSPRRIREPIVVVHATSSSSAQTQSQSSTTQESDTDTAQPPAQASIYWDDQYTSARQSCVHVGISDRVLDLDQSKSGGGGSTSTAANALPVSVAVKTPTEVYKHEKYRLDRQFAVAKMRKKEVDALETATRNTVDILRAILNNVYWGVAECFADMCTSGLDAFFRGVSGETEAGFRMLSKHGQWVNLCPPEPMDLIMYHQDEIEGYLRKYFDVPGSVARLCATMESTLQERCPRTRELVEDELQEIGECLELQRELELQERDADVPLAKIPMYGTKIAHLVLYLQRLPRIQVVVFTMWANALRVVEQALRLHGIACAVFLQHQSSETKSAHVQSFVRGETQVLLLHSLTSASGINLQCASHVIFLDPMGHSALQASALEQQAIGRVLRMGQAHAEVSVVRLVAEQTLEAALFDDLHAASAHAAAADDAFFDGEQSVADGAYMCFDFAAPIRRVVRMEVRPDRRPSRETLRDGGAEDEEIAMVGAMSLEEIINRRVASAAADGVVLDLTEDADESLEAQLAVAKRCDRERALGRRHANDAGHQDVAEADEGDDSPDSARKRRRMARHAALAFNVAASAIGRCDDGNAVAIIKRETTPGPNAAYPSSSINTSSRTTPPSTMTPAPALAPVVKCE